jgi:hypothetical protein
MIIAIPRVIALSVLVATCSGCGANIELQRSDSELGTELATSSFYLDFDDGSQSKPDNIDGYLNFIWTNDATRARLVAEHLQDLQSQLQAQGFRFVTTVKESTVRANLQIKSVRFDPVLGWITDDARIVYASTRDGADLGTVVADEIWFTPTIKMVFDALVEGSLRLWGLKPDE